MRPLYKTKSKGIDLDQLLLANSFELFVSFCEDVVFFNSFNKRTFTWHIPWWQSRRGFIKQNLKVLLEDYCNRHSGSSHVYKDLYELFCWWESRKEIIKSREVFWETERTSSEQQNMLFIMEQEYQAETNNLVRLIQLRQHLWV